MNNKTTQRSIHTRFGRTSRLLAVPFLFGLLTIPGVAAAESKSESGKAYVEHRDRDDRRQGRQRANGDRRQREHRAESNHDRRRHDGHRRGSDNRYDRGHRSDDRDRYRHDRRDKRHYRDRQYQNRQYRDRHYRDRQYRDRHYRDRRDHYRHNDSGHRSRYSHRRFSIPRQILRDLAHSYHDYLFGRVYYKAHRHHHDIYRFPVYHEDYVEYRPYAYCEGKYFATGVFGHDGPRFDIHLSF